MDWNHVVLANIVEGFGFDDEVCGQRVWIEGGADVPRIFRERFRDDANGRHAVLHPVDNDRNEALPSRHHRRPARVIRSRNFNDGFHG